MGELQRASFYLMRASQHASYGTTSEYEFARDRAAEIIEKLYQELPTWRDQ